MGTRSDIIVCLKGGKWRRIYCHWDGHLKHNGATLHEHYNSQAKAEKLVALGDLSILAPKCTRPKGHTFEQPVKGYCVAYGRDRKECSSPIVGCSLAEVWPEEDTWTEFTYVWDGEQWLVGDPDEGSQTLIKLADALEAIKNDPEANPIKSGVKVPFLGTVARRK